jgi:HSP20 family molecular chaperone IbpA
MVDRMTPTQLEVMRRQCRLGMAAVGGMFVLMFVRLSQRASSGPATFSFVPDDVQLILGIGSAVVGIVILIMLGLRVARQDPKPSWWRTEPALWVAVVTYGVGCGLFLTWCLEVWREDSAMFAMLAVWGLGLLALLPERGARPAGAILLAVFVGGLVSLGRINLGSRGSSKSDEVVFCWVIGMFLLPLSFLLLRGLLNVVKSQEGGDGEGVDPLDLELPVQVVARDGTYLVTLEAPGLADAQGVEARVEGKRLHVLVPRTCSDPAEELLFSTRFRGSFPVVVELPQVLQDPPWSLAVERGLLTVQVAPLGDA